jgi:cytochrome b561
MEKYPLAIRITHWLMALLILCLLAIGLVMTGIPRSDPLHNTLYGLHKSFGVVVLCLWLLRVCLRLALGTPVLPGTIPAMDQKLAHAGHALLYLLMIAMPLSGILMTNSFGFSVNFFGIMELPKVIGINKSLGGLFSEFHTYAAYALIGLIVLHVAGLIKHRLKERVNLLQRMV